MTKKQDEIAERVARVKRLFANARRANETEAEWRERCDAEQWSADRKWLREQGVNI